jgi:hypothetical protein
MHGRWIVGLGIAGAGLAGLWVWPVVPTFEIVDGRRDRIVLCARVKPGEEFMISFMHSVNRRPVYDTFRVEADHLVIVKSRYDSFGAGMPESSTTEGTLTIAPDGWMEWTVNRSLPEVAIRVGQVAGHKLHFKSREVPLSDLADPGSALTLRVRKAPLFDLMKGRCTP